MSKKGFLALLAGGALAVYGALKLKNRDEDYVEVDAIDDEDVIDEIEAEEAAEEN